MTGPNHASANGEGLDFITVLETHGPLATKRHRRIGDRWQTESYGRARIFTIVRFDVTRGIRGLASGLSRDAITRADRRFVVRGDTISDAGIDYTNAPRRLHPRRNPDGTIEPATLRPAAHHWIALDIDTLACPNHIDPADEPDEAVEYAVEHLPPEFHGATCFWQFTASQSIKPGLSLRLWFWSDRKLTDEELKIWLADSPVDPAIFAPAQPIYTAFPIFEGSPDPLPWRCGLWEGDRDEITAPAIDIPRARPKRHSASPDARETGGGYDHHRAAVGDHEGGAGFFRPLRSAVAAWLRQNGSQADTAWLRDDLEQAIRSAVTDPAKHSVDYIEARVRDLDPLIESIRELQADSEAAEEEAHQPQDGAPTYPEPTDTCTLPKARERVAQFVDEFVREVLKPKKSTDFNPPTVIAINAPPGIGKTHAILQRIPELLKAGLKVVIVVPTHVLGEQLARDIEKKHSARVYRSRDAADPLAIEIDTKMCLQTRRTKAIRGALGDEEKHGCKSGKRECQFYRQCGFQRQKKDPPKLWIVAHQLAYRNLPKFIDSPDVVIIDEAFHDAGNDRDLKFHIHWLIENRRDKVAFPDGFEADQNQRLIDISIRAHQALTPLVVDGKHCRITRATLAAGLTVEAMAEAAEYEWKRKRNLERDYPDDGLAAVYPGQEESEAITNSELRVEHNLKVEALATFWEKARDLLASDLETSLNLYFDPCLDIDDECRPGIRIMRRSKLHDWVTRRSILHLDATMNQTVVKQLLPQAQFREVNVKFPATETALVKQVIDRINGKSSLTGKRVDEIREEVKLLAGLCRDAKVAVICSSELEKDLRKVAPSNVTLAHYHHLRGRNDLEKVDVHVLIGRDEPSPGSIEAKARLLFEREVAPLTDPPAGKTRYYDRVTQHLRLRDGKTVSVENHQHPDGGVEALRWLAVEAELIQAVYRARPLNRTPWRPLTIYLLTAVCLPLPVDRVMLWKEARPSLCQRMMQERGMATDSPAHASKMFPDWFKSGVEAAKKALQRQPYRQPRLIKTFLSFAPVEWEDGISRLHIRMRGQNPVYSSTQDSVPSSPQNEPPDSRSRRKADLYASILFDGEPPILFPVRLVEAALFEEEWPGAETIQYREIGSRANRPATLWYDPRRIEDPLPALSAVLDCELAPWTKQESGGDEQA